MAVSLLLSVFFCSLLITYITTPSLLRLANKKGLIDRPNERKIHTHPTPHLGGIALFAGVAVTFLLFLNQFSETYVILGGALLLVVIGVFDDLLHVPASFKLGFQLFIATFTVLNGISIEFISHPFGGVFYLGWLSIPITIIWIVSLINIINLLDGSDGLAAGVSGITAITLLITGIQHGQLFSVIAALAILGSCLGFLRYNFFPAKIFMGDAGSMFLGYLLATTSVVGVLKSSISLPLAVPILVLAIPILDTVYAIYRRVSNGQAIFTPDKEHIHHRLLQIGLNPGQVAMFIYAISAALGALGIFLSVSSGWQMVALLFVSGLLLGIVAKIFLSEKRVAVEKLTPQKITQGTTNTQQSGDHLR
jgi:UDP-GlcNAc:undecaprenyl-phosphate GlcNAc-1-phosphate transferase